tara:strand:+ start:18556 stop:19290 length:735 start_codon:yes stop_codon:yes gene_type:complete
MNFCTCFSESHRVFFDKFFLKSFPFSANVSLVVEELPQRCGSGYLFTHGWRDQMIEKQKFIAKCLRRFDGEICVFCDVDIYFYNQRLIYKDLINCLGDKDVVFIKDHPDSVNGRGAGFFILKSTSKMRSFFEEIQRRLTSHKTQKSVTFDTSEQGTINDLLSEMSNDINWDFLPERYYTHGKYINGIKNPREPNGQWWDQKDEEERRNMFIPQPLFVHHANWCAGVKNKIELLEFVIDKYKRNA